MNPLQEHTSSPKQHFAISLGLETCHSATGRVLLYKLPILQQAIFFQPLGLLWSEAMFVKCFRGASPLDSRRRQQENGCPLAEPAGAVGTAFGTSL